MRLHPEHRSRLLSLRCLITPDGLRIAGSVGVAPVSIDDAATPMSAPCVWDLKEDGTYGEPVVLPYPKLDWTNRVPQYVMGLDISADGKTVIGQITDYQGMMHTIIYFTLNDENKWEYHNNFQSLANPNNVQLPDYPGEAPEQPQVADFMTEENKASYNEALQAWQNTCTWDPDTYPNFEDYMSADELAAYNAAMDEYQTKFQAWEEASNAFYAALESCGGTDMVFNNVILSRDGKTAYSSAQISEDDPLSWFPVDKFTPVKFDLTNGTHTMYPLDNILISAIADDGTIMGASQSATEPQQAYVYLPGSTEPITLMDYFKTRDAQTYAWMQENILHDYEAYDPETYEPVMIEDYPFTGVPRVTPDLKLVATSSANYWDIASSAICFSYILPDSSTGAVNGVAADKLIDEANAPVYNAQGILVGRGTEALRNLPAGIYVIGSRKVIK